MPPTSKAPAAPRGLKARATAKVGPLPVYGWALLIVGAYLVYSRYAKKGDKQAAPVASGADVGGGYGYGSGASGELGAAGGGGSAGGGATDSYSPYQDAFYALLASFPAPVQTETGIMGVNDPTKQAPAPPQTQEQMTSAPTVRSYETPTKQVSTVTSGPLTGLTASSGKGSGVTGGTGSSSVKVSQSEPTRYYTYAPGKAPKGQKANEAPSSGTLKYKAGKGYYVA